MKYKTRFILYIVLLVMVLFIMYMIRTQTYCNGLYSDKLLHI